MSWEEVNPWGAMEISTGKQLATRDPRDAGGIHVLPRATDDAIQAASRRWPQRDADEFEQVERKRWVEIATGREFKRTNGNPRSRSFGRGVRRCPSARRTTTSRRCASCSTTRSPLEC